MKLTDNNYQSTHGASEMTFRLMTQIEQAKAGLATLSGKLGPDMVPEGFRIDGPEDVARLRKILLRTLAADRRMRDLAAKRRHRKPGADVFAADSEIRVLASDMLDRLADLESLGEAIGWASGMMT